MEMHCRSARRRRGERPDLEETPPEDAAAHRSRRRKQIVADLEVTGAGEGKAHRLLEEEDAGHDHLEIPPKKENELAGESCLAVGDLSAVGGGREMPDERYREKKELPWVMHSPEEEDARRRGKVLLSPERRKTEEALGCSVLRQTTDLFPLFPFFFTLSGSLLSYLPSLCNLPLSVFQHVTSPQETKILMSFSRSL